MLTKNSEQLLFDKARLILPRKSALSSAFIRLDKKGFTLMEVLVSLSIFVIVVTSSLSIYMAILKASQKTVALTRIQQESQLIMSVLAKKIRTSQVSYDYNYNGDEDLGIDGDETELALIDLLDNEYVFAFNSGNKSLTVAVNGGQEKTIPMTNVQIENLKFYINPSVNPYSLDAPPISQPYVTIVMTVSSTKAGQTASLVIQQTVPQRSGLTQ